MSKVLYKQKLKNKIELLLGLKYSLLQFYFMIHQNHIVFFNFNSNKKSKYIKFFKTYYYYYTKNSNY